MIAKFDQINKLSTIGNKAKFLIEMKRGNFNIPDGFVIDNETFVELLKNNNIFEKVEKLLSKLNKDNIHKISVNLISLMNGIHFDEDVQKQILANVKLNKMYAVRSSGSKEDLDEYSFAGQYKTFLNVSVDNLFEKIKECYKSVYSEAILNYLLDNNISAKGLGMSVVIQEMVQSDFSGICFTINPISGNDKEMVIEVGEGLGENIVSGKVSPEQYYFNWYDNAYNYDKTNKILNKQLLDEMTRTFLKIQLFFGYPCDIEFAIYKNKLYILQSRKITKIKYNDIADIWTTADFKDGGVSATVCTPFMWSLYEYVWESSFRKFFIESKILSEEEFPPKLGEMFYGRCYWNLSTGKKAMSKVIGYKEREFDSEYGIKKNYEGDGHVTRPTLKSIVDIVKIAIAQRKILKTRNENVQKYKEDLLNKYYTYKNCLDNNQVSNIKQSWYTLVRDDYLQSETTYFWQIFINTIHQALYKEGLLKYVSESDYLTLLGGIENISHLLPFYDMWTISRDIRKDQSELEYWQKNSVEKIIKRIKKLEDSPIIDSILKLIEKYGYHSDKELDITYKCYYEDITPFIITLKDMIALEDKFGPINDKEKGKKNYEKILKTIKKQVAQKKYLKLKDKIEKMRKMLWWREELRDVSTRFYYIIRMYTIELAKELYKENMLDDIENIWFLKIGNLWDFLDNKLTKNDLKKIIAKNKLYYNSYKNYMSENEIGQIFSCESDGQEKAKQTNKIAGVGANNGRVIGTARVIESFDKIEKLQKNDILITKYTDTGWTAKFAILSGIVTEYGGILCHAAIVSREYGIPAIVNCKEAMSKIKDGQKIMIDGTKGTVTIIED